MDFEVTMEKIYEDCEFDFCVFNKKGKCKASKRVYKKRICALCKLQVIADKYNELEQKSKKSDTTQEQFFYNEKSAK